MDSTSSSGSGGQYLGDHSAWAADLDPTATSGGSEGIWFSWACSPLQLSAREGGQERERIVAPASTKPSSSKLALRRGNHALWTNPLGKFLFR